MYVLGLDIGTTGCKAAVFDERGSMVASAYKQYPLIYPQKGWMELDPEVVVVAAQWCIARCVGTCNATEIRALAVSSQGEAVIPVGRDGRPLCNSIVTFDTRNVQEYEWFQDTFDKADVMRLTGAPIHTMFSITKMLWIRNHLPEVYAQTWKFMCFGDYITYRLGAEPVIDYSMAARTMAFDIRQLDWSDPILETCALPRSLLPAVAPAGHVLGRIGRAAASELGLPPDMLLVTGSHDQLCCALGAGVLQSGMAMASLGTTESIVCVSHDAHSTPQMIERNLPCYPYAVNGLYAYLTFLSSCGSVLSWFTNKLVESGDAEAFAELDAAVAASLAGPSQLYVLPYFAGSGTPYLDVHARGAILGLTLDTDRNQIYLAILEALCMEARFNIECMQACGIDLHELRCIGGGSKSRLWLQLKADITGKKVLAMQVTESGCAGAAMLAGIGCGMFPDAESARKAFVKVGDEFVPDKDRSEAYSEPYHRYLHLYELARGMY